MTEMPPPHSLETEQHALACMMNRDADFENGTKQLRKEDFHLTQHQVMFLGLKEQSEKEKSPCTMSLYDYVKGAGHDSTATLSYIMTVANLPVGSVCFETCIDILQKKRVATID